MKFLICFTLGLLTLSAIGERPPSGGRDVKFNQPFLDWKIRGARHKVALATPIKVSNKPFRKALRIQIATRTQREYDLQMGSQTTERIKEDDALLLSFYVRCEKSSDESALGRFHIAGQANNSNRPESLFTKTITADKKWKRILIPFAAPIDNKKNYSIVFRFGGTKPQTLQIGGFELLNYRNKHTLESLPATESHYPGMESDAPWRKEAEARIEKIRKENLRILVTNRAGKPISGAKVHVVLQKHAFGFGAAVGLNSMFNDRRPEDAKKYQTAVEDLFNKITFENRMKWRFFKDNDPQLEQAIAWCAERNIPIRGHCMVWPAWKRLPSKMKPEYENKPDEFRKVIENHIRKMATIFPNTFSEWDVVNELYSQHEFVDLYGKPVVTDWFRIAKESNPNFKRYINDYAILAGYDKTHQDNYYEWIQYLLDQKAPVDGIGFQGHFRAPIPPEEILRRLDRFAQFGLEMQITEYDFDESDELLQSRFTRDFMTAVFSHPQTTGIITWCLWEKSSWKSSAAFFSARWKKRRIARAWEYMVKKKWHTDRIVKTAANGTATVRGFLGDYEITIGNSKKKIPFKLKKGSDILKITL